MKRPVKNEIWQSLINEKLFVRIISTDKLGVEYIYIAPIEKIKQRSKHRYSLFINFFTYVYKNINEYCIAEIIK